MESTDTLSFPETSLAGLAVKRTAWLLFLSCVSAGSTFGFSDPAKVDAILAGANKASPASFTKDSTPSRDDYLALAGKMV